jgi:hypothetical protein
MSSTTWITPQWLIDSIGLSDLDPCGYKLNGEFVVQCAHESYSLQDFQNGLNLPWHGSVYCNPPYNDTKTWMKKCRLHHQATNEDVIMLIKPSFGTQYFYDEMQHSTGIVLMKDRLRFLDGTGTDVGMAHFPTILVAFGDNAFNRIRKVAGTALRTEIL